MILVRSPLRVSLGGGGTDLPSYYELCDGFVVSAAINKYVYVAVNRPFSDGYKLKYAEYENVISVSDIKHPIIREALNYFAPIEQRIEISTMADIPSGTGLGSSGSFTTALIKSLSMYFNKPIHAQALAELSCDIEINRLKEPIGKQDQYIAAFGGITAFNFSRDGRVTPNSLNIPPKTLHDLEDNLLLFFTGSSRSASNILRDQDVRSQESDVEMLKNLNYVKKLGYESRTLLESGDFSAFGTLMNEHWEYKRSRSNGITNDFIDNAYKEALRNGAIGGKLVGAGGGGFLMFYASDCEKLRSKMSSLGMEEVRFKFDFQGTSVVISQ